MSGSKENSWISIGEWNLLEKFSIKNLKKVGWNPVQKNLQREWDMFCRFAPKIAGFTNETLRSAIIF